MKKIIICIMMMVFLSGTAWAVGDGGYEINGLSPDIIKQHKAGCKRYVDDKWILNPNNAVRLATN